MALAVEESFEWREFAACDGVEDRESFFAEVQGATYHRARLYCATCPVVIDCLIEGIDTIDNIGMWGCMSPNERNTVRLKIRRGRSFKAAVESIWSRERKRVNGMKVPSIRVWDVWDA